MPLIPWKPLYPHWDPFDDMDRWIDDWPSLMPARLAGFTPSVDVYEKDNNVVVETPLAGVDPKDVEVSFENGAVVIKGKTERKSEVDEKNFYRKEVRYGSFYRRVPLPAAVKEDKAQAESENGVLKVVIPKAVAVPSAKKIAVKVKTKK